MNNKVLLATAIAAVLIVSGGLIAAPAYADDDSGAAVDAVAQASPATIGNAANVSAADTAVNAIQATIKGTGVTIPVDPSVGVDISTSGQLINVGLPNAGIAANAVVSQPGVVSYDNNDGSSTVPVVSKDGALTISTVIANADAPTKYAYPITIRSGGFIQVSDDGSRAIVVSGDSVVAEVGQAWAKDALGNPVPTRYETDGTVLTQVVDLSSTHISYPVVADPKFVWYAGFIPSLQLNKSETRASATATGAAAVCGQAAKYLGYVGGIACGASILQIIAKGAINSQQGLCSWLVLEGPLVLAWTYSGGYCK